MDALFAVVIVPVGAMAATRTAGPGESLLLE